MSSGMAQRLSIEHEGRVLSVTQGGDPHGLPVFVHHGTPSAGVLVEGWLKEATADGILLITYDRPGYGGSDRDEGRSVADAAEDVVAIADALGIDRFATWGISGGGPHALACAALLPDRLIACGSLASVAPWGAEGLDFLEGMGEENHFEFGAALQGAEALAPYLKSVREHMVGVTTEELIVALSSLLTEADRAALTGETAAYLQAGADHGLRTGVEGWVDDDLAFTKPWGFDLADIQVPVLLWQGEQDNFVPTSHGLWLADRIPNVDARISPDEGHLTLLTNKVRETHAWLKEHA